MVSRLLLVLSFFISITSVKSTATSAEFRKSESTAGLYNAVVAQNGSGDYKTVQSAIDDAPTGRTSPWLIFIMNGSYKEIVIVPANKPFIHLIGQDKDNTIIHEKINVQSQPRSDSKWIANDTVAWKFSVHNPAYAY